MNNELEKPTIQSEVELPKQSELADTESINYDKKHYNLIYDNFYPIPNLNKLNLAFLSDMADQYGNPILSLAVSQWEQCDFVRRLKKSAIAKNYI